MTDLGTTAAEVLDGVDLSGRTALVTGGYSGIGVEVVRRSRGPVRTVLAPGSPPRQGAAGAGRRSSGVEVGEMDLSDQASVAAYAESVLAAGRPASTSSSTTPG